MFGIFSFELSVMRALPLHGHGLAKYVVSLGGGASMTGTRDEIESFASQLLESLPAQEPEVKAAA